MLNILKVTLFKEWRYYCPSKITIVTSFFNEIVILLVFWYTAKAFVPSIKAFGNNTIDYFTFIVVGETALRIPAFFITVVTRNLKNSALDGTLDSILLIPSRAQNPFLLSSLGSVLVEVFRVTIVLLIAKIVFSINISIMSFFPAIFYQILSLPIFIGIGLLSISIFLILGRGDGLIMKITSLATILAGAYFPTSVLPESIDAIGRYLSPFNLLLHSTRDIISKPFVLNDFLTNNLYLLIWGVLIFPLAYYIFGQSIKYYKKRSRPFTFIS